MRPAATVWPSSFTDASKPQRSSIRPRATITATPDRIALGVEFVSNTERIIGSLLASRNAASKPNSMPRPPQRGIGIVCTSRSRTAAIAPQRIASTRTSGIVR